MAKDKKNIVNADTKAENKKIALSSLIKTIEKQYGEGSISLGKQGFAELQRNPTGSLNLDMILGGGLPDGRIYEIYGPESSGKTSICLMIIGEYQKMGKTCAYIDAEHALDPAWASKLGVDMENMLMSQPNTGEEALNIVDLVAKSGAVDLIVVDSVAALVPQAELDGEMGDANIGLQARLMSKAMRKISGALSQNKCSAIFINQLREKVGIMFGNPETTTGGRALKFYSSIRLETRREDIKDGDKRIGQKIKLKTVKNKTYPPYRNCEVVLMYDEGFSEYRDTLQAAISMGVINKSGSWFSYNDEKLGQGENNSAKNLEGNPELYNRIKEDVMKIFRNETSLGGAVSEDDPEEKEFFEGAE